MSKTERARLLAFYRIRSDVRAFASNAHYLEKLGVTLEQWLEMDPKVRKMKIEFARLMPT